MPSLGMELSSVGRQFPFLYPAILPPPSLSKSDGRHVRRHLRHPVENPTATVRHVRRVAGGRSCRCKPATSENCHASRPTTVSEDSRDPREQSVPPTSMASPSVRTGKPDPIEEFSGWRHG